MSTSLQPFALPAPLEQAFRSHLLTLKKKASSFSSSSPLYPKSPPPTCAISYAWPFRDDEQDLNLQERVLQIAEDLESAGVKVQLDLITGDSSTDFESHNVVVDWIERSDFAVLVGSRSYLDRSNDASTTTFKELHALNIKRQKKDGSVIALILSGGYSNAMPEGYSGTMCANLRTSDAYLLELPDIASKMHGYALNDTDVVLYKHKMKLLMSELRSQQDSTKNQQKERAELLMRSWEARVQVLTAKFTLSQRRLLDWRVLSRTKALDGFFQAEADLINRVSLPTCPEENFTPLLEFLSSPHSVLLLKANNHSTLTQTAQFLASQFWKNNLAPMLIDLNQLSNPTKDIVEQRITLKGFDRATILQLQEERSLILVIEGFDKLKLDVNLYMHDHLNKWKGKVIFTCCNSYLLQSPHSMYYFMPGTHFQPNPNALMTFSFTSPNLPTEECKAVPASAIAIREVLLPSKKDYTVGLSNLVNKFEFLSKAYERDQKNLSGKLTPNPVVSSLSQTQQVGVTRTSSITLIPNEERRIQGFILLQDEICRPILHSFLESLVSVSSSNSPLKQAFISYAWPPNSSDCISLQHRLVKLVEDLSKAQIKVLLDIQHLSLGVDINKFMEDGINSSDYIIWIGTPRLKERIVFAKDGSPDNNATVEFMHISRKFTKNPKCLVSLWFLGNSLEEAFPTNTALFPTQVYDLRQENNYYQQISILASTILNLSSTSNDLLQFHTDVKKQQMLITDDAIHRHLALEEKALQKKQAAIEAEIQHLLNNVSEQYRKERVAAEGFHEKALTANIEAIYLQILAKKKSSFEYYIPLQGAFQLDSPPSSYFDALSKVKEFLADKHSKAQVLLIQAGAGAGKTTFAHFLEFYLLQQHIADGEQVLPLFLSLPHISNPFQNLTSGLFALGFTEEDISRIKNTKNTVFILDSLDELPIETTPKSGLLEGNGLFQWKQAQFIITCRSGYLNSLFKKLGTPYSTHITQNKCGMKEMFLMPFNDTQVTEYLKFFVSSGRADWDKWETYDDAISSIDGLKLLSRTPFVLKLIVESLPQLLHTHPVTLDTHISITRSNVYDAFISQFFEKEMWRQVIHEGIPINENRLSHFWQLAQMIAQRLFEVGVSQTLLLFPVESIKLLRGLPLDFQQMDTVIGSDKQQEHLSFSVSFIHKSVQDFLTAKEWLSALAARSDMKRVLSGRLVSAEVGLLEFVTQRNFPKSFEEHLFNQVLESRGDKSQKVVMAAANASTILNFSNYSFSNMDLSGVSICGANLDNVLADSTNFQGATLEEVSLKQAWLRGANLKDTNLSRVNFGQQVYFNCNYPVFDIAIGNGFFAAAAGTTVQVWDITTRQIIKTIFHLSTVANVAIVGELVISASYDSSISLWNSVTDTFKKFVGHKYAVTCMTLMDNKVIISGGWDHTIRFWDIKSGSIVRDRIICDNAVMSVLVVSGKIVSSSLGGIIQIWEIETGKLICRMAAGAYELFLIYFEGKIISGGDTGSIKLWDINTGEQTRPPIYTGGTIRCLAIFDGKIISGSAGGNIKLWDIQTGQMIGQPLQHKNSVECVTLHNNSIVSGSKDRTIKMWDMFGNREIQHDDLGHAADVKIVLIYESFIISGSGDQTIRMWDIQTCQPVGQPMIGHSSIVTSLAIFEGKLISGSEDKTIQMWDLSTQEKVKPPFKGHSHWVSSLVVVDGLLASSSFDETIRIWDMITGLSMAMRVTDTQNQPSSDEKKTMLASHYDSMKKFGSLNKSVVDSIPKESKFPIFCLATYKGDILSGGADCVIRMWDINKSEQRIQPLQGHTRAVVSIVVFGDKIVSGSLDGTIRIWNLEKEQLSDVLQGHTSGVSCVALFREFLIFGSYDQTLRVWDLQKKEQVEVVKLDDMIQTIACNDKWIIVGTKNRLQWWKLNDTQHLVMMKSVPSQWKLHVESCELTESKGLSDDQKKLLLSLGAQ